MHDSLLMSQDDAKNFLNDIYTQRKITNQTDTIIPFIVAFFDDGTIDIISLSSPKDQWQETSEKDLMNLLSIAHRQKKCVVSFGVVAENIVAKADSEEHVALIQQWKNMTGSLEDCPYVKITETMSMFFINTFSEYYDYVFLDPKNHNGESESVESSPHTSIEGLMFDILKNLKEKTLNIYSVVQNMGGAL